VLSSHLEHREITVAILTPMTKFTRAQLRFEFRNFLNLVAVFDQEVCLLEFIVLISNFFEVWRKFGVAIPKYVFSLVHKRSYRCKI